MLTTAMSTTPMSTTPMIRFPLIALVFSAVFASSFGANIDHSSVSGKAKRTIILEAHIGGPIDIKLELQGEGNVVTKLPGATETTTLETTTFKGQTTFPSNLGSTTTPFMEMTTDDRRASTKAVTEEATTSMVQITTGSNAGTTTMPLMETTTGHVRYRLVNTQMSWQKARDYCLREGGHLALPDNEAEYDEINRVANGWDIWIGVHFSGNGSVGQKSSWINECGKVPNYDGWYSGEPENEDSYRCAIQSFSDGKWRDNSCTITRPFVCQFGKRC